MKISAITPCLYPDISKIRLLVNSATKHGLPIKPYGYGCQFQNWKHMMLEHTLPYLNTLTNEGYTHALYVDGIDSVFMSGMDEIVAKYQRCGSPQVLMSADSDTAQFKAEAFTGKLPWRFLNAGGWIGSIGFFIATVEILAGAYGDDGDYQNWFIKGWPVWKFELDHDCSIFQSMNGEPYLLPRCKRVLNAVTGTWPSILHFRGGYCDPETGRESRILPFLKEIEQS